MALIFVQQPVQPPLRGRQPGRPAAVGTVPPSSRGLGAQGGLQPEPPVMVTTRQFMIWAMNDVETLSVQGDRIGVAALMAC